MNSSIMIAPLYSRILSRFPQNFSFCFAYGSGVKKQLNDTKKSTGTQNMIDLIYCVDNPHRWHKANIQINPSHYSSLKYLGHSFIVRFQEKFGAKVYFNTLVDIEGVTIKYGVISKKDLITDLLDWCDIYLAGRLHKPVEIIKSASNVELQTALQLNIKSAVHAALLMLPESFSEYEFYHTVSNISYGGDFRMTFGENKNKVENIVKPQLIGFRNLYLPVVKTMKEYVDFPIVTATNTGIIIPNDKNLLLDADPQTPKNVNDKKSNTHYFINCSQDVHPLAKLHHLNQLPKCPQRALVRYWNKGTAKQDTEDVLRAIAYDPDCNYVVRESLKEIVWNSSVRQSLKGIATAGIKKSVVYSGRKIMKIM